MLVSFDVKSLFTSIPVSEAIEICERRLQVDKTLPKRTSMDVDTIMLLVRLCLNNTSFLYGGQPYQQLDHVAMERLSKIFCLRLVSWEQSIRKCFDSTIPEVQSFVGAAFSFCFPATVVLSFQMVVWCRPVGDSHLR